MSGNLLDVIRYEGDNSSIVHKHSIQDFNSKSQLIVGESQEAIFFKDGQALDLFTAGRHSLNSDNFPILKRIFGAIFGKRNPFQCEVFFINKVSVIDIPWGTDSPISLIDPVCNLLVGVKSNGQMGVRVLDSRKFLIKIVGQLNDYNIESVKIAIKGMVKHTIKEIIAKAIVDNKTSILHISAHLSELAEIIKLNLNVHLAQIGLTLENFFINGIYAEDKDLEDLRQIQRKRVDAMTDIDIESTKTVRLSQARATARETEGYTYHEERRYDIMQAAASNEGVSGAVMSAGMGAGMGFGLGGEIGRMTNNAVVKGATTTCTHCNFELPNDSKFCPSCGKPTSPKKAFCISCGAEIATDSRFCPQCGTAQKKESKICPACATTVAHECCFCQSCGHKFEN